MKELSQFSAKNIRFVFIDIDDTMTTDGKLPAESYQALWKLADKGFNVVPITGRPAGWCEMIARFWPVSGVIGENGALYYVYKNKKMKRHYAVATPKIKMNRAKLDKVKHDILSKVSGAQVASDQFCRLFDLAIDFCEDVKPLPPSKVEKIVEIFEKHGARAKVSSIHVNGWFGDYDKLKMCSVFMKKEFALDIKRDNSICAFIGDSPNDEPMFGFFENSFAVENIKNFLPQLKYKPAFVTTSQSARGFVEFSERLLSL